MHFTNALFFAASALALNAVHFVNQDDTERTIIFTAQVPLQKIPALVIPGQGTAMATFPDEWIGNWYSVSAGKTDVPGMLGEVRFGGFAGHTYFDVSAIVNPQDTEGVKMVMPKNHDLPVSGCQSFPCSNAYNKWDDIATLSTEDTELICLLGNLNNQRRRSVARMPTEVAAQ